MLPELACWATTGNMSQPHRVSQEEGVAVDDLYMVVKEPAQERLQCELHSLNSKYQHKQNHDSE